MSEQDRRAQDSLAALQPLLDRLEALLGEVDGYDDPVRGSVFELLDGIDALHRLAILQLSDALGSQTERLRQQNPAVNWLFEAYGVGVDDREAARRALDPMKPYLHEHGGDVEVIDVSDGVVRLRMSGACSGCTASAITLREGVEEALRDGLPGFRGLDVEPDTGAKAHPPPGPTLLQIQPRPA